MDSTLSGKSPDKWLQIKIYSVKSIGLLYFVLFTYESVNRSAGKTGLVFEEIVYYLMLFLKSCCNSLWCWLHIMYVVIHN